MIKLNKTNIFNNLKTEVVKTLILTLLLVFIFSSAQMTYANDNLSGPLLLFSPVNNSLVIFNHHHYCKSKHKAGKKELILRTGCRIAVVMTIADL